MHGLGTTPYDPFNNNLYKELLIWKNQGNCLILMMDANEHILDGYFMRQLGKWGSELEIEETTPKAWIGGIQPNTYIDGSKPITGVCIFSSLKSTSFQRLLFIESVGDHRTIIFDISTQLLLDKHEHKIVWAGCQRLN